MLLRFACEVVHPVIRKDPAEEAALVNAFNGHLAADGRELVEDQVIDGRPIYVPQKKVHALAMPLHRMKAVAATLDSATLYEDLRRLERIGDAEPGEAIALAKEIVEGCCKLIPDDREVPYSPTSCRPVKSATTPVQRLGWAACRRRDGCWPTEAMTPIGSELP